MTWPKILLLAFYAYTSIVVVANIGKPRKPTTPGVAVGALVIAGGLATLVVLA